MTALAQPHGSWQRLVSTCLLLIVLANLLASCGGNTVNAAPAAPPVAQAARPAVQVAAPATVAQVATKLPPTAAPVPTATASVEALALDDPQPLLKTTNILLLGSDRRANTPNWRTDVIMIVAVDRANNRVGVISLPRDLYIDQIPNRRGNKINVIDYLGEQDEPNGGGPKL